MQNLINFLYRFRTFGFFLILELICVWLIVSYNQRQNAAFLNSSNFAIARFNNFTQNTGRYVNLVNVNQQLLEENEFLRNELARINTSTNSVDTSINQDYSFIAANVINNTYQRSLNYFTIDVGHKHGIEPGMGVVSGNGVVGQVKSVSENFATVTSVLHLNLLISSSVKSSNTLCTVQWDGLSPYEAEAKYIPRHIKLQKGDSVVTSGYNSVFPSGVAIGTISSFELTERDAFYTARIKLSSDFTSLVHGYVVKSHFKKEKDSLEYQTIQE